MADPLSASASAPPETASRVSLGSRLVSLDALRGFDMFWILGADSIGHAMGEMQGGPVAASLARQLDHVAWEGFRFYDLIFPLFVFMVGISLVFSLQRIVANEGKGAAIKRIVRRSVLLYLLGVLVYGGFSTPLEQIRLLGVLQRIALCYFATGLLFVFFRPKTLYLVTIAILVGYWALVCFVPAPGQSTVSFAEGQNIVNWFDAQYLPWRKWDGDHDPEGILSTFPAIATCLLGVFAGLWMVNPEKSDRQKTLGLVAAGAGLLVLGYAWGFQFPIIKKLWTSSYVLVAAGWSAWLLAGFFWVIDVLGWRRWAEPFIWIGMNPIALYLIAHFVDFAQLASRLVGGPVATYLDTHLTAGSGPFVISLTSILLCVALARLMYVKKLFIRL
ncbi:MAG TPA: DUF5009 domain-containing protein [Verrucomicrobiota bacterium]|nr:DUF5009 domain-containing protein [Verrucomicrobiales bacterium]HRI11612.1 DUF5009 domain-containing protein [Verrucomicrobiota bacterium]